MGSEERYNMIYNMISLWEIRNSAQYRCLSDGLVKPFSRQIRAHTTASVI